MDDRASGRIYYRIRDVCNITGLKPHVLRYWEQEFKGIKPEKTSKGQRLYTKRDIEMILTIKRLLYEKRLTIEGAKKYLSGKGNLVDEIKRSLHEIIEMLEGKKA